MFFESAMFLEELLLEMIPLTYGDIIRKRPYIGLQLIIVGELEGIPGFENVVLDVKNDFDKPIDIVKFNDKYQKVMAALGETHRVFKESIKSFFKTDNPEEFLNKNKEFILAGLKDPNSDVSKMINYVKEEYKKKLDAVLLVAA